MMKLKTLIHLDYCSQIIEYKYKYFAYTIAFGRKDTLPLRTINLIIRIAAKFKLKFLLLRTLAVMGTISWSWDRPHRKSRTSLIQRSWSRKAAVDVNTFHRSHLRNWKCYHYYHSYYYCYYYHYNNYYYHYCCCYCWYCCCRWWYFTCWVYLSSDHPLTSLLQSPTE